MAAGRAQACDYARMESLRATLPGWRPPIGLFDKPADARLRTTPLSCSQLAIATYGDPTHNDLLSSLDPVLSTAELSDHTVRRLVGRRATTAANANRICEWSQVIDRDGDEHVYGLNYQGQILVDGARQRNGTTFLFSERLYNADGLMTEERRPTRGDSAWNPSAGYTRFQSNEVQPTNHNGWDEWLPVFWARRMNLVRTQEYPKGGEVVDFDERTNAFTRTVRPLPALQIRATVQSARPG